jgi:von Willebrand factor A domain-containing protein 8
MESFRGFEHKFQYRFFGHSGDGPAIDLMGNKPSPRNEKEMFAILTKMQAHAAYCISGGEI